MEACIGLGLRRIGDGIAQMNVHIGAAAFFIDPGELTRNALPHPEPALRGLSPAGVASAAAPTYLEWMHPTQMCITKYLLKEFYLLFQFQMSYFVSSFALLIDYFSIFRGQGHPTGNSSPFFGPS
jgi:hypothetical protein